MLDGQQRKQNRTGYGNDRNHIDHIVGCYRKHGGCRGWVRSCLCGRALWLRWHSLRSHGIPGNEEGLGQACFGCLTLTLSLSRFAPDLERTMTCPKPRMLNRAGKPELLSDHGLRFQTECEAPPGPIRRWSNCSAIHPGHLERTCCRLAMTGRASS